MICPHCGHEAAISVKLADLRDHLRPNCPEQLRPRYELALTVLTQAVPTPAASGETPSREWFEKRCAWYSAELDRVKGETARLLEYVTHKRTCTKSWKATEDRPCRCGLDDVMAALRSPSPGAGAPRKEDTP